MRPRLTENVKEAFWIEKNLIPIKDEKDFLKRIELGSETLKTLTILSDNPSPQLVTYLFDPSFYTPPSPNSNRSQRRLEHQLRRKKLRKLANKK